MRDIRRPEALDSLVERLTSPQYSEVQAPVFDLIIDLLIFAAGIGLRSGKRVPVSGTGKGLALRIFENNQKDGFIYLVALADKKDPKILESASDNDIAQIFEEYAASGLEQINEWLNRAPSDVSGVETLIAQLQVLVRDDTVPIADPSPV